MSAYADYSETIGELIETCIDGEKGFAAAAAGIDDPRLKDELMRYSQQRASFAQDLQRLVRADGKEPPDNGSLAGAAHRGWINIKQAVTRGDKHQILAECERGEDSAVEAYRKALDEPLPPSAAVEVASQYQVVQHTHDRVRDLRDATEYN